MYRWLIFLQDGEKRTVLFLSLLDYSFWVGDSYKPTPSVCLLIPCVLLERYILVATEVNY